MKIKAFFCAVLIIPILFSGCARYVELSERAIVEAIGVDYIPDKRLYRLSMQYFYQSSEGGQNQIDKTQPNVLKAIGEGKDIMQAARNASLLIGKDLLLSENRIIILGADAVKLPLDTTVEFFISNFHSHPQSYICATDSKAEDIIDIRFKDGYASPQHLVKLIENAADKGLLPNSHAYEIMTELQGASKSALLPFLTIAELPTDGTIPQEGGDGGKGGEQQTPQKEKTVIPSRLLIFRDNKAVAAADTITAAGIQLIRGDVRELTVSVPLAGSDTDAVLTLYDIVTEISADIVTDEYGNQSPKFKVNAKSSLRFDERGNIGETDTERIMQAVSYAEQRMCQYMETAVKAAQDSRSDIFGLENILRHANHGYYREISEKNKDKLRKLILISDFEFSAKCDAFSLGLQSY